MIVPLALLGLALADIGHGSRLHGRGDSWGAVLMALGAALLVAVAVVWPEVGGQAAHLVRGDL